MNAIDDMLRNEYRRLKKEILTLQEECRQRPKGALVAKRRGNQTYAYLVKREEGKVVTSYIGRADSWKVRGLEAKIDERKRYEKERREAETRLRAIERMLKVSGTFFVEPSR